MKFKNLFKNILVGALAAVVVKDHNGNYVAPNTSEYYTYNSTTREITIQLDTLLENAIVPVLYECNIETPTGDVTNIYHKINNHIIAITQ